MISFQNFSFRYEESKDFTLRGIDMTVQTGEFILLTGRSGCGKTTLIRSLKRSDSALFIPEKSKAICSWMVIRCWK